MRINSLIICDDIRIEASGKHILIGVYPHNIVFGSLPAQLAIHLWLDVTYEEKQKLKFAIRGVLDPAKAIAFEVGAEIDVRQSAEHDAVPVGPVPCLIGQEGNLTIQFRINEGQWEDIRTFPLITARTASTIVSQRLS